VDAGIDDPRFVRVMARRMLGDLAALGLTVERLVATARHMRRAQEVLDAGGAALAAAAARTEAGDVVIDAAQFRDAPLDTRTRLLATALGWVSGQPYRPRYAALEPLASGREGGVLNGCLLTAQGGALRITREFAAVRGLAAPTAAVWDRRWRCDGPHAPGLEVRALTRDGLAACPDWRATGLPATSLQATPAVWRGAELVAAPLAGMARGWSATLVAGRDRFSFLEHSH
jgi:tRNA(Ile)-lysidine synthase